MSSNEMQTLDASNSPAEMVAGPAEYWEIARPLIAERCSQGSEYGSGLKCTPRTLFAYLHSMHQTFPLPDKPLPETSCPVENVRTTDTNLDGLSWKGTQCSPAITPWMGQGSKREAGREKSWPPRTPETRPVETINWDCAGSTPPNYMHPCPGAQGVAQSIPPWPGGPAICSTHVAEHDSGGEEVAGYAIGCSLFRDDDCNSCPQANSWLAHDSCLGSPSEMGGASTALDEARIAATGDATIHSWLTAYDSFNGPAEVTPHLPSRYDGAGTDSGPGSIVFLDRPAPFLHDPNSGVASPHGGDVDPNHPLSQQPDAAPCASPVVPAAAVSTRPGPMGWAPVNAGHLATNSISVQTPEQSVHDPELPSLHTAPDDGSCQEGSRGMRGWPADEVWYECRRSAPCSSVDGTPVPLWGMTPSRADVNRLLDELQGVQRMTAFTISLVSVWLRSRFQTQDREVMSVPWDQIIQHDSPIPSPLPQILLIPMYTQTECALLEVHLNAKAIVHYSFSTAPGASNAQTVVSSGRGRVCETCRATTGFIAPQHPVTRHPGLDWQIEHRPMHSATDPGVTPLWTLHQRAAGCEVRHDPPKDFPLRLAQSLTRDLIRDQAPLCPGDDTDGAFPRVTGRPRWFSCAGRCTDPTALVVTWEQIAQIPVAGRPMGGEQADRLMQLVFNIASPATLIGVKHQLLHLRARDDESPHAFTRTVAGVFEAGLWHRTNEQASRVGLALTCWSVHQHRRRRQDEGCADPMGQTVTDIVHHLPKARRDRRLVGEKVREWSKRAWPWNQLIRAARGSPNILCFLPQGTNCFRGQEGICMTEYRTLRKVQFVVMEQLLQQYRPQLLSSVPADFFEIFLYNHVPPYRFAVEQWTDEEILREPVDSTKFDRAFEAIRS